MKKFAKLMSVVLAIAMLFAMAIPVASVAAEGEIAITIETVESEAGAKNVGVKVFMPTGWSGVGFTFNFDPAALTFKRFEQNLAVQHQARDGEANVYALNRNNAASGEVIVSFASAVVVDGKEGYYNVDVDDDTVYDYFGILVFDVAEGVEGLQAVTATVDKLVGPDGDIEFTLTNGGIQLPGGEQPPEPCDHEWSEWEVTTPATCVAKGEKTRTCTKCQETETEEIDIDPDAHAWGEWMDSDKEGWEQRVCANDPSHVEEREKSVEPPVNPDALQIVIETVESEAGAKNVGVKVFMPTGWSGVGFTFNFDPAKLTFKRFEQNLAVQHQARDGEANVYALNRNNAASGEVIVSFASAVVVDGKEGYYNVDVDDDTAYDYFGILVFDVAEGLEDGLYEVTATVDKLVDPDGDVEYTLTNGGIKLGADECEHDWVETGRTPATCTEAGSITYTCSKCQETKEETIDPLDHDWGEWEVTTPATCTEKGEETRTCQREGCGATETREIEIDPDAHDWVEIGRTPATCAAKGSVQYACSINPDHTKEEELDIDPDAHDWGEWTDSPDKEGWEQRVCKNDPTHIEEREKSVEPPVHEHTFGEPTYIWADDNSTCTATRACTADGCDVTETETVNATSETTPATCAATGKTVYTATFENAAFETQTTEVTIDIDPNAHAYGAPTYKWADDNSTCTATMVCANDASHVVTEKVNTTSETTPATTEAEGKTVYTATFENSAFETQTKEVTIPKLNPEEPTAPAVTGITDGQEFDLGKGDKPAPTWEPADATATLNGKPYTAGTAITEAGDYTLVVTNGDKTTTIKFKVTDSSATNPDQPNTSDLPVAGIAIVSLIAAAAVVVIARKKRFAR